VYCLGSGIFLQQVEVEVEDSGRRRHADRGGPGRIVRTAERRERKPWLGDGWDVTKKVNNGF
jgi:hypothetical protein